MIRTENGVWRKGSTPTAPGEETCPNKSRYVSKLLAKRKRRAKREDRGEYESEEQRQADVDAMVGALRAEMDVTLL